MNIETIMQALFAKLTALKNAGQLVTVSRRLEHINDFAIGNMPAAFQHQTEIDVMAAKSGGGPKNRIVVDWYVYVGGVDGAAHSPDLNPLITALCQSIKPLPGDGTHHTLGGLVDNVYVDGKIEIYEGVLADRAVAIIPLTILVPGY